MSKTIAKPSHPKISEKNFLSQLIDLAHIYRWRVAHFRPAMTTHGWRTAVQGDGVGFPDLILVRDGRLIVAEVKTDKGKVTPEQSMWLDEFIRVEKNVPKGIVSACVWRPSDFEELQRIMR